MFYTLSHLVFIMSTYYSDIWAIVKDAVGNKADVANKIHHMPGFMTIDNIFYNTCLKKLSVDEQLWTVQNRRNVCGKIINVPHYKIIKLKFKIS